MATKNMWQSTNPASVISGGLGVNSVNPYAVICGGATSTGPVQSLASNGNANQILGSNGAAALPSWKDNPGTAGAFVLIETINATNAANIIFDSGITSTYLNYMVLMSGITSSVNHDRLNMTWSINGGSSYFTSNYIWGTYYFPYNSTSWTRESGLTPAYDATCYLNNSTGLTTGTKYHAQMWMYNITGEGYPHYYGNYFMNNNVSGMIGGSTLNVGPTTIINAIKFNMSSGTISGSIKLYGFKF